MSPCQLCQVPSADASLSEAPGSSCHPPSSCNWMPTEVVITNPSQAGQAHLSLFIIRARILIITKPLNIFREEGENQINKG